MILSGKRIREAVLAGDIVIEPFEEGQISPNSYDFRLGNRCKTYRHNHLDARIENETVDIDVPPTGIMILPEKIYLFNIAEKIGSEKFVPIIRGRSSVGRLGLFINITADLIDIGSISQWTLQLHSVIPVKVFPGMLVGQVTFWQIEGDISLYRGKYSNRVSPVPSLSYLDFEEARRPKEDE